MKPLRAFLFAHAANGEWASSAFRDLEPLIEATKAALSTVSASAVLHVGFWRPETLKIAELATIWPGVLLLSESALNALPPPIKASSSTVAIIDGLKFRIALDGFGYEIEDPTISLSKKQIRHEPSSVPLQLSTKAQGWVNHLIQVKPNIEAVLLGVGIYDENSFQANEGRLELSIRLELALDRYTMLAGERPSASGILNNLHACPRWFLDSNLKYLELTVRIKNVCIVNDFRTIDDLTIKGYNGLLKLPNFGQGSVQKLGTLLWKLFLSGEVLKRNALIPSDENNEQLLISNQNIDLTIKKIVAPLKSDPLDFEHFSEGLLEVTKSLKVQESVIWIARIGFQCTPQTLQQIADQIGLTRERVRQIENSIYNKVSHHSFWRLLESKLANLFKSRTSPLFLEGISALDPWFQDSEKMSKVFEEIFNHLLLRNFSIININETLVISRLTYEQWNFAVASGKTLLRALAREQTEEDSVRFQIEALLNEKGSELREELWNYVTAQALWSHPLGQSRKLTGYGRTAEAVVLSILENSKTPLHYEEIHKRANLIGLPYQELRGLHNAARNVSVLYARGTYGLLSHCPLSIIELAQIEAEVEDIVAGGESKRQWHTSELLDELLDRGLDFDGKISKYLINIALQKSTLLVYMRRMVWGLKDSWADTASSRLDVRQAVLALLENSGRPLSTVEIRELLKSGRGVNSHFQIHPAGNLIRLGPLMWGLADRDIRVKNPDELLEKIANHLIETQEGIHVSEVPLLLGSVDEEDCRSLLGICQRKGMHIDRGQYAYLTTWGQSRRIWPSVAIRMALLENPIEGVTLDYICSKVNLLTKRYISRTYIGQSLSCMDDSTWDPNTEHWKIESNNVEETEEET